jgi:Domain of unknown function (DUF5076)
MPSIQMPQDLQDEQDAQEVIRVWFDDGRMELSLDTAAFEDPAAYGIVLSDLSHRMAQICALNTAREPEDCFQEIVRGLKTRLGMINEGGDDA